MGLYLFQGNLSGGKTPYMPSNVIIKLFFFHRLKPVTPSVGRILSKDVLVSGYRLQKGVNIRYLKISLQQAELLFIHSDSE